MSDVTLSTDTVVSNARLPYWRDVVCETFVELECESASNETFFGSIENTSILDIQFSKIRAAGQRVVRTRSKIARSNRDYFLLSLQTHGHGVVEQDGRTAVLQPGDFALYDTTRPYDLTFQDTFGQIVLRLPRDVVSTRIADAERMTALRIQGDRGAGRLASAFLHQLHAQVGEVAPLSVRRLHASAVDLLATALAEQAGAAARIASEPQNLMRQRIHAFIDAQIGNPNLNCEMIAAEHQISERYLRKLFEGAEMSVSEWIWRRRLEQAKRDLMDPLRAHLSVTSIGYDVGFKDSAHFSRAFRARYGMTPRDMRNLGAVQR